MITLDLEQTTNTAGCRPAALKGRHARLTLRKAASREYHATH